MDELIGNDQAAAYVGLKPGTWRPYVRTGHAPPPHRRETRGGHALPVWTRAALDEWQANRPGRGAPGRPRRTRSAEGDH
jgi:hypothetical protein